MPKENSSKCSEFRDKSQNTLHSKSGDIYISKIDDETRNIPEETIPEALTKIVTSNPKFPVLKYKSDPNKDFDVTVTFEEYLRQIKTAARNFIALGLDAKSSVVIIGYNHPAWFISELGSIFAGGISCGVYTTNSADACKFIINDCNCQIAVVENDDQLNKLLSIITEIPQLKAIIKYIGDLPNDVHCQCKIPLFTWNDFLTTKFSDQSAELERRIANIKPHDCAILIYTSGTTGLPKGVMISHDNAIFSMKATVLHLNLKRFEHTTITYLPLSHIAANLLDILFPIAIGSTVYFAQPDSLKGSLGKTLKEVRPTIFFGVPRIFEKIQEQLTEIIFQKTDNSKINSKIKSEKPISVTNNIDTIKLKQSLGFDRCEYIVSAAAPISLDTLKYFHSLDINIQQAFGMSESSGPQTLNDKENTHLESVGVVLKGVEMKILEPDENSVGEICCRGRHICLGYYNNEKATKEAIDSEGWLHSGDLGKVIDGEYLIITGRIKELIITAGGENIAPTPIEERIKNALPFVNQVMLVGDHRKFISCLLTLKTEVDFETQIPKDNLLPAAIRSLSDIGVHASTVTEILQSRNPILYKFIDETLKKINILSVSRAAHVQKWILLPRDFSIYGGELGPTMKMRRSVISSIHSNLIDPLYE